MDREKVRVVPLHYYRQYYKHVYFTTNRKDSCKAHILDVAWAKMCHSLFCYGKTMLNETIFCIFRIKRLNF